METKRTDYKALSREELITRLRGLEALMADSDSRRREQTILSTLTTAMRWNEQQELCSWADALLAEIASELGIESAALYTYDAIDQQLNRCGSYALPANAPTNITLGEGLAGQALQDEEPQYIRDASQLNPITFGVGTLAPTAAWFQPLITNQRTVGLLEITAAGAFSELTELLIPQLAERLANSLAALAYQDSIRNLFQEAQDRSDQLNAQEEELRQNVEEMAATQEEMKRAQLQLARSEAQLNSIIDSTNDLVMVLDAQFNILYANRVARNQYEAQGKHLRIGMCFDDVLPKAEQNTRHSRWNRALAGESFSIDFESTILGEHKYLEGNYNPLVSNDGTVTGVTMFIRDISARKRAQLELQQANEELETQQEELRQQMEELAATQDELSAQLQGSRASGALA